MPAGIKKIFEAWESKRSFCLMNKVPTVWLKAFWLAGNYPLSLDRLNGYKSVKKSIYVATKSLSLLLETLLRIQLIRFTLSSKHFLHKIAK